MTIQDKFDNDARLASFKSNRRLSKRERFAMAAMQGLISGHSEYFHGNGPVMVPNMVAEYAVRYADELLKQLEK
jgi:hypothetical protein